MAEERIRITWDEVHSPEVDAKIKQQELLQRAQDHYAQQAAPPPSYSSAPPPPLVPAQRPGFWYNTIVYTTLFGLIGGLIGWLGGEIVMALLPTESSVAVEFNQRSEALFARYKLKELNVTEYNAGIEELKRTFRDNAFVRLLDEPGSQEEKDLRLKKVKEKDDFRSLIQSIFFYSVIAMSLAFMLSSADLVASRNARGILINGSVGIALGLLGGVLVGLFIDDLYRAIRGEGKEVALPLQLLARMVAWAIIGLFVATAPGLTLRNGKRLLIGMAGGLIGGVIGGLLFDPVSRVIPNSTLCRLIAITAIGVVSGASTGWIETVSKTGWLRVVGGLIVGKQFIIYRNPTTIGSAPECEIFLFKDTRVSPRHAALHVISGGFELEDLRSATGTLVNGRPIARTRLRHNDQIQIGMTTFLFQEKVQG